MLLMIQANFKDAVAVLPAVAILERQEQIVRRLAGEGNQKRKEERRLIVNAQSTMTVISGREEIREG